MKDFASLLSLHLNGQFDSGYSHWEKATFCRLASSWPGNLMSLTFSGPGHALAKAKHLIEVLELDN